MRARSLKFGRNSFCLCLSSMRLCGRDDDSDHLDGRLSTTSTTLTSVSAWNSSTLWLTALRTYHLKHLDIWLASVITVDESQTTVTGELLRLFWTIFTMKESLAMTHITSWESASKSTTFIQARLPKNILTTASICPTRRVHNWWVSMTMQSFSKPWQRRTQSSRTRSNSRNLPPQTSVVPVKKATSWWKRWPKIFWRAFGSHSRLRRLSASIHLCTKSRWTRCFCRNWRVTTVSSRQSLNHSTRCSGHWKVSWYLTRRLMKC